jgi:IS6 family transposase
MVAVRWYPRYTLSYRDVEELLIDAARLCRRAPGDRWFVDETSVTIAGWWVYLCRVIDQCGQVIDVLVVEERDLVVTRWFFIRALDPYSSEVITDRVPAYPGVLDELPPGACPVMERYAHHLIESDHGWLTARLRPMRGLKRLGSARVISTGHAFVQDLRCGHYELGMDSNPRHRLPAVFTELACVI